ncbi:hypothetical protein [Prosthecobacter sp.]|uniref:hypothetical protein n=1 Tax=Prosthecobacter sp. TaxID=1965333 RepID=UPI002487180A|nr:hypothetical protein [Prosthecobacter sp.]MDI1313260.1 hypothetical protein [Prosthecobacter sp.]
MKPSADPLVLKQSPFIGDPHPKSPQWRAVNIRLLDNADVEGKVIYMGPQYGKVVETFVLKAAA